jgi:hypothetical protein
VRAEAVRNVGEERSRAASKNDRASEIFLPHRTKRCAIYFEGWARSDFGLPPLNHLGCLPKAYPGLTQWSLSQPGTRSRRSVMACRCVPLEAPRRLRLTLQVRRPWIDACRVGSEW